MTAFSNFSHDLAALKILYAPLVLKPRLFKIYVDTFFQEDNLFDGS